MTVTINGTAQSIEAAILSLADAMGGDRIDHIAPATDGTQAQVTIAAQPRPIPAHEADALPLPGWWWAICNNTARKKGQ
ncbi:MAG: hypothetical protein IKE14_09415 [Loktanella sp.]|nr:hypothetical protein [Loktanella sp.]